MGCETSRPEDGEAGKINQSLRRNKKKVDKIIGRSSSTMTVTENVVKVEEKLSSKDQSKIAEIITPHFFFSNFSQNERS